VTTAVEFLILAAVIPAIFGPLQYAFSGEWYKSHIGRGLMIGWTALGLITVWAGIFVVFGDDFPGRELARLVVFVLIFVALWYKWIALILIRVKVRRGDLE
jgi:hypothetical protein